MAALRSAATSTACALTTALTEAAGVSASTGRSTQSVPQIEETTAYGYRGMIENYLKPQLGEIRLQKLTARDIQQYYTWLMDEKKLSPNTVIKHHNLLTNALNAAERQEYITKNPMRAVSPPKKRQHEAKFYTPEQLGVLLAKAVGTRLELPVYICAYLGLRRNEGASAGVQGRIQERLRR